MIPQNKQEAVTRALQSAFGVSEYDSAQLITTGLSSALVIRIEIAEQPYLLRIITRNDEMANPARYFSNMTVGAEAGLAPAIRYLSVEDRISITDFVTARPFPLEIARTELAQRLRQLHRLPPFPRRIHYFDAMEIFMDRLKGAGILPEPVINDLFSVYQPLARAYPRHEESGWTSCHNDLKPENILFDGRRSWLVDWEGAFLNDPYLDLAVVANFVAGDEQEESQFLETYFEAFPTEYQRARFYLMQQMLHAYYFTLFMFTGSANQPVDVDALEKPGLREVHQRIWNGQLDLAHNHARQLYGRAHLEQLLNNRSAPRFRESINLISRSRASQAEGPSSPGKANA